MRLGLPLVASMLVACSGPASLRTARGPLVTDASEVAAVHAKVDEAVKAGEYADAWDLEAASGRDRARLEAIALASLAADDGPYEKMFAELVGAFHGLSPEARARVGVESKKAVEAGKWERAAEIEIAAAEDAPAYKAAFAVYERTPSDSALAVLKTIDRARRRLAPPAAPTPPSGGEVAWRRSASRSRAAANGGATTSGPSSRSRARACCTSPTPTPRGARSRGRSPPARA